jgi:hypothetical protein
MDTLRGHFSGHEASGGQTEDGLGEDEAVREPPPAAIGQDERRMQVRAYNYWASLLDNRSFPSIEDLDPESLPDFGPYSVLLDFTCGIDSPGIQYLGDKLAEECGSDGPIRTLSDVPGRSLLSRITDHYMQILANQAPIGFEAEFVNNRGLTLLYRGILLPFSSDDDTIDFIYGVINWKELADQQTTDELLLEIDQALEAQPERARAVSPMAEWADGPADCGDVFDLVSPVDAGHASDLPEPAFGADEPLADAQLEASFPDAADEADLDQLGLADWLASARELAVIASSSEDRTRAALYAAIGRAHDFALAAAAHPEDFAELIADAGLTMQDRAQMTPVVKLVFGAAYDKTRLAEYAAVLAHASRTGIARGTLAAHLAALPGGLKAIVQEERQLRRGVTGESAPLRLAPRAALARKLRKLDHTPLDTVCAHGSEFALLVARRLPSGEVVLLGEVSDDIALLEKAARKLV